MFFLSLLFLSLGCEKSQTIKAIKANNPNELFEVILSAKPGYDFVVTHGVWKDVQIKFSDKGTPENPIILWGYNAKKLKLIIQTHLIKQLS